MPRTSPTNFPNLDALILDGQITIGKIPPIGNVAIATNGQKTIAMLRQRPGDVLLDVLQRLDEAVKKAIETDVYTDEINTPVAPSPKRR
ncbi:MAG TPA: hypothetical protein VIK56_06100 [Rhodoferax sp.]